MKFRFWLLLLVIGIVIWILTMDKEDFDRSWAKVGGRPGQDNE